jgi:hypothetical protein
MRGHQKTNYMENIKAKLITLIAHSPDYNAVVDILKNEALEIRTSQQTKSHFLNIFEIRLKHNDENRMQVPGLKQLVDNLRNTDIKTVALHVIQNDEYGFAIYTDEANSKLFGII